MKLRGMIYENSNGDTFFVRKESLPKKKGYYSYWIADEADLILHGKSFRETPKRKLIDAIRNYYSQNKRNEESKY